MITRKLFVALGPVGNIFRIERIICTLSDGRCGDSRERAVARKGRYGGVELPRKLNILKTTIKIKL